MTVPKFLLVHLPLGLGLRLLDDPASHIRECIGHNVHLAEYVGT